MQRPVLADHKRAQGLAYSDQTQPPCPTSAKVWASVFPGSRLDPTLDHAPLAVDHLQFDQTGKELDMTQPVCRQLPRQLAIFPQNCWQPQRFEAMLQKYLGRFGHAARPRIRAM